MKAEEYSAGELVGRIQSGDQNAETELVARYAKGLRLVLLKRAGDPELAKDLSQEALIITLQRIRAGGIKNPDSLPWFLQQTAVNLSIAHFRKEKRYITDQDGIIELKAVLKDKAIERMNNRDVHRILKAAINQLSVPRDRAILERFYLQEDDKATICQDLQLSTTHFDRVLYRARQRMKALLQARDDLCELLLAE